MSVVCGFFCNFANELCACAYKSKKISGNQMKRILFVNQDIIPYVEETELSKMGKLVPQKIQEAGAEIRTFMPRWGNINERRGQLHEVIRLSGINISIDDTDHPLIIKVASIMGTKVQVYFIDNEEFFSRKGQMTDENGVFYDDNNERIVFFARGVVETIKKLRWTPDIIHCQGQMAQLLPLFLKKAYKNEPGMEDIKVVTSLYEETQDVPFGDNFKRCMLFNELTIDELEKYNETIDGTELAKIAIDYSDGVIKASKNIKKEILDYADASSAKLLDQPEGDFAKEYIDFYESL